MATTYAVASDLTDIVETPDGFGKFPTKLDAVNHWVGILAGDLEDLRLRLNKAERMQRRLIKKG